MKCVKIKTRDDLNNSSVNIQKKKKRLERRKWKWRFKIPSLIVTGSSRGFGKGERENGSSSSPTSWHQSTADLITFFFGREIVVVVEKIELTAKSNRWHSLQQHISIVRYPPSTSFRNTRAQQQTEPRRERQRQRSVRYGHWSPTERESPGRPAGQPAGSPPLSLSSSSCFYYSFKARRRGGRRLGGGWRQGLCN